MRWMVAAVLAVGPVAYAQSSDVDATREPTVASDPFVDESVGFELKPPLDSIIESRERVIGPTHLERVRFRIGAKDWTLVVALRGAADGVSASHMLATPSAPFAAASRFTAEPASARIADRSAAIVARRRATLDAPRMQHVAAVALPPNRFLTLVFDSPLDSAPEARGVFDDVLATLRFPGADLSETVLTRARVRARAWRDGLEDRLAAVALPRDTVLRVVRDGVDVGLVRWAWQRDANDTDGGIRFDEHLVSFGPDGAIRQSRTVSFVSDDLRSETWEMVVDSIRPPFAESKRRVDYAERGVREHTMIALAYADTPGTMSLTNRAVEVPDDVLPGAVARLLPHVLDLATPGLFAFSRYSSELRGAVTQIVRVSGPESVERNGQSAKAYRVWDRDRLLGDALQWVLDEKGNILWAVRGDETMLPTTADAAQRILAERMSSSRQQTPTKETSNGLPTAPEITPPD